MSIFTDYPKLAKMVIKMEKDRKRPLHLFRLRMLHSWYDKLREILPAIGEDIHGERYTGGSTTCTFTFLSKVVHPVLDDWLRAKLDNFTGWMDLVDHGESKR